MKQIKFCLTLLSLLMFSAPVYATGAPLWQANGIPVSNTTEATKIQNGVQNIYAGNGEIIIGWYEPDASNPSALTYKLYVQKVDINGNSLWSSPVYIGDCQSSEGQKFRIVSAEAGAAVFVWEKENSDIDLYAQKITSTGSLAWGTPSLPKVISDVTGDQRIVTSGYSERVVPVVSDGSNVFIVWHDSRAGAGLEQIYGAVVEISSGTTLAGGSGGKELLPTSEGYPETEHHVPAIVSVGTGSIILGWGDKRNNSNYDIFAQKFTSSLARQWVTPTGGVTVCASSKEQEMRQIVSDGAGGAVLIWEDERNSTDDIYGERINSSGGLVWNSSGVKGLAIVNADLFGWSDQTLPKAINDGSGIVVTWSDASNKKGYTRKISLSSGNSQWISDVLPGYNTVFVPEMIYNGQGSVIVAWSDTRQAPGLISDSTEYQFFVSNVDVYAQKINTTTGTFEWPAVGIPVANTDYAQMFPYLSSDGQGGAVVGFLDNRDDSQKFTIESQTFNSVHVYAQRIGDVSAPTLYSIDQITFDGRDFVPGTDLYVDANPTLGARLIRYYTPIDTAEVFVYVDGVAYDVDQANNYSVISAYEGTISGLKLLIAPGASPTVKIQAKDIDGNSWDEVFEVRVETLESEVRIENQPLIVPPVVNSGGDSIITYNLTASGDIDIFMFSPGGKITKTWRLAAGTAGASAGYNEVSWDGRSDSGELPGRGIYPIKIIRRSDKSVIGKAYMVVGR